VVKKSLRLSSQFGLLNTANLDPNSFGQRSWTAEIFDELMVDELRRKNSYQRHVIGLTNGRATFNFAHELFDGSGLEQA